MNFVKNFFKRVKNEMAGLDMEVKGSLEIKSNENNKEVEYDLVTDFNNLKNEVNTIYFNEAREVFLKRVDKILKEDFINSIYGFTPQYFTTELSYGERLNHKEIDFIVIVLNKRFKTHTKLQCKRERYSGRIVIEQYQRNNTLFTITKEQILEILKKELNEQQDIPILSEELNSEDYKLYFLTLGFLKSLEKLKQDFLFQYQKFSYQYSDTIQSITRIVKNEFEELGELSAENERIILDILQPIWTELDNKYKDLVNKQKEYEKELRETSIQSRAELLKMELEIVNKIRESQNITESNDIANIILNDIKKDKE